MSAGDSCTDQAKHIAAVASGRWSRRAGRVHPAPAVLPLTVLSATVTEPLRLAMPPPAPGPPPAWALLLIVVCSIVTEPPSLAIPAPAPTPVLSLTLLLSSVRVPPRKLLMPPPE